MEILETFLTEFYPDNFIYKKTEINYDKVTLFFHTKRREHTCPTCGKTTNDSCTYYTRTVQDLPILDKTTYVKIKFRKMVCNNKNCETSYFNEPLTEFVKDKKRYSNRLIDLLIKIALTGSAEGGARVCKEQQILISGDKLLQLAKEYEPKIDKSNITKIGIDDFALKKNIDMELFL